MTIFISQNILVPFSYFIIFFQWRISHIGRGALLHEGFTITLRDTTLRRTPSESDQPDAQAFA
jgi:hypothetical protein